MLAHEKLGPIRDAETLREALDEYAKIEEEDVPAIRLSDEARETGKNRGEEIESALSIRNLALLGRILGTAALAREESRGAHFRLDFPETDDGNWRRVTRIHRNGDGGIEFSTDPVKEPAAAAE
jgi:succinate dehydrogenase/fumarate reductase flavoprotein subunit